MGTSARDGFSGILAGSGRLRACPPPQPQHPGRDARPRSRPSGRSAFTTAFAPTTTSLPMRTPSSTFAPVPSQTLSPSAMPREVRGWSMTATPARLELVAAADEVGLRREEAVRAHRHARAREDLAVEAEVARGRRARCRRPCRRGSCRGRGRRRRPTSMPRFDVPFASRTTRSSTVTPSPRRTLCGWRSTTPWPKTTPLPDASRAGAGRGACAGARPSAPGTHELASITSLVEDEAAEAAAAHHQVLVLAQRRGRVRPMASWMPTCRRPALRAASARLRAPAPRFAPPRNVL